MGKHTMTNNPALIEPDRFDCIISKKRRLEPEESNESAALCLLLLKCRSFDTSAPSERNFGSKDQIRDFQREQICFNGLVGNTSHDVESIEEDRSHNSATCGKDVTTRTSSSSRRGCLHLTKLALTHPSILLERSKVTAIVTAAATKKSTSFGIRNSHLPKGRPLPLPPHLPNRILLCVPPRTKGVATKKIAQY